MVPTPGTFHGFWRSTLNMSAQVPPEPECTRALCGGTSVIPIWFEISFCIVPEMVGDCEYRILPE